MRLVLKGVPPSLNTFVGKRNGYAWREAKKQWTQAVFYQAMQQRHYETMSKAMVRIDYFFPDMRRRDPDNYCGKLLMDGLTKAGIIEDDDFFHISTAAHGHVDRENPRTEITILRMWEEDPK